MERKMIGKCVFCDYEQIKEFAYWQKVEGKSKSKNLKWVELTKRKFSR